MVQVMDPEALGLALHHHGPTFINAHQQTATNWLIDLYCPSASSSFQTIN